MKILLLGIQTDVMDEGAKNVATNLSRELSKSDEVLTIYQREALSFSNLRKAIRFQPNVILSVHGPSAKTIALLFMLRVLCGMPRTAVIGTQPQPGNLLNIFLRVLRPHRVFAQSRKWHDFFKNMGLNVTMLPNGTDLMKFSPCTDNKILSNVRENLGIKENDKVVLHIGPINYNRNHELLIRLQRESSWKVIVIGSTTENCLPDIRSSLEESGAKVFVRYFPDINLIYAISDVYVFPVMDESGSIEFPLTVLEAMACDRPVATTPFRGLPDFLAPSDTFKYFRSYEELIDLLPKICNKPGNRKNVVQYSWAMVAEKLRDAINSELASA